MHADRLEWAIRDSFLAYLEAVEATIELVGGAERVGSGAVAFPIAEWTPETITARGTFHARAHGGALDFVITDPGVRKTPEGWVLEWVAGDGRNVRARLLDSPDDLEIELMTFDDVALTAEGAALFGGNYAPWTRMSPLLALRDEAAR